MGVSQLLSEEVVESASHHFATSTEGTELGASVAADITERQDVRASHWKTPSTYE